MWVNEQGKDEWAAITKERKSKWEGNRHNGSIIVGEMACAKKKALKFQFL